MYPMEAEPPGSNARLMEAHGHVCFFEHPLHVSFFGGRGGIFQMEMWEAEVTLSISAKKQIMREENERT